MSTDVRAGSPGAAGSTAPGTNWPRIAALGGVAFFLTLVISLFAPGGSRPSVDDSTTTITNYYVTHHTGIMIADYAQALGIFFFAYFLASLWCAVRRAEGSGVMAVVVAVGGGVAGTTALLSVGVESALTFKAAKLGDPALVRALYDLNRIGLRFIWFPLAAMIAAASLVAVQRGVLPRWLAWAGLVTVVVMLIASLAVFADKPNIISFLGFIAFILFGLWTLATAIVLYLRPATAGVPGP